MIERLDEERLEILRSWGAGLAGDSREELRAAGKAITILVEEIERLHVELWHAKAAPTVRPAEAGVQPQQPQPEPAAPEPVSSQALATSLRDRIRAAIAPRSAQEGDPSQRPSP
jgi:hypothetical protein